MNGLRLSRTALLACLLGIAAAHASGMPGASASPVLTVDSVNLSAGSFFAAYTSKDDAQRQQAQLYLLGVQDATEGTLWCDYKTLKTVTLREFVFEYFKKQPASRMQERASRVIEDALRSSFPCKRRTKKP